MSFKTYPLDVSWLRYITIFSLSLECCYCYTKNGGAFPGCCLSNFLTPLTIESLFNYWRWYPYSFETTIEQYVVSQHISHFSNYRLLSRNSTFDTTSHFSTRLSALTQKYYPKQITTHPSITMFVNQCGNHSITKDGTQNETGTSLINSAKDGNCIYIQKIFLIRILMKPSYNSG